MSQPEIIRDTRTSPAIGTLARVTTVALATLSGFFGIIGMTAIFAAAVPIIVMVSVLEAAKLVTVAWLARHWNVTPSLLRVPLTIMMLALMTLTAISTFGFLMRAELTRQRQLVDQNLP